MYFQYEAGRLASLPAHWTSVVGEDPIRVLAAGRSHFRVEDLREMVRLMEGLHSGIQKEPVKRITP